MPQMNPDLLQMMAELADDSDIMNQISQSVPSRSRGAGSRVSIGGSGGSGYSVPQLAREYVGQEQASAEAADDGQNGPVAAKSHAMAYMEDPQWQHWDKMRSGAVNNMKGGGGFWGWATGGRYNNALGQEAQYADYMARQIEQRYLNEATLREAAKEHYDFSQPTQKQVWNETDRKYYDTYVGDKGGVKRVETAAPQKTVIDQFGRRQVVSDIPGGTPMVTDPTKSYSGYESKTEDVPAFSGGEAESYAPMAELGLDPKTTSEIMENEAQEAKYRADASRKESPKLTAHSPGSWVTDETGKVVLKVPQTASQSGDRPDRPAMTYEEAYAKALNSVKDAYTPDQRKKQIDEAVLGFGFDPRTRKPIAAESSAPATTGGVEVWVRDPNSPNGWRKESSASETQQPAPQAGSQAPVATGGGLVDSAREVIMDAGAIASAVAKGKVEEAKKIKEFAGDAWGAATNPMGFARRMRDKYLP